MGTELEKEDRYYYFHDHKSGFGWGVLDSKVKDANGDSQIVALVKYKGYAKILADIMNGEYERSIEHAKDFKPFLDTYLITRR